MKRRGLHIGNIVLKMLKSFPLLSTDMVWEQDSAFGMWQRMSEALKGTYQHISEMGN